MMESEGINLKWTNFSSNITKNIERLRKNENYVDVTVYSEGKFIQAHKIILSASSTMFKEIFDMNRNQHPVIILQDVSYRELTSLITFIYNGEVSIEQKNLLDLLRAAKTLKIDGLTECLEKTVNFQKSISKKRKIDSEFPDNTSLQSGSVIVKEEPQIDDFEDLNNKNVTQNITSEIIMKTEIENEIENENENEIETVENPLEVVPLDSDDSAWLDASTVGNRVYLCPFCVRNYMNWGFRRRHISLVHSKVNEISCRWCPDRQFQFDSYKAHLMSEHLLRESDTKQVAYILNEALNVLSKIPRMKEQEEAELSLHLLSCRPPK